MNEDILSIKDKQDKIRKREERKKQREQNDIRKLLKLVEFRRFISRFWAEAGLTKTSFVPGKQDQTNFNLGQHNMALWVLDEIMNVKPESFAQILREFRSEALSQKED